MRNRAWVHALRGTRMGFGVIVRSITLTIIFSAWNLHANDFELRGTLNRRSYLRGIPGYEEIYCFVLTMQTDRWQLTSKDQHRNREDPSPSPSVRHLCAHTDGVDTYSYAYFSTNAVARLESLSFDDSEHIPDAPVAGSVVRGAWPIEK